MNIALIIAIRLIELFLKGLMVMLLLSIFTSVSWTTVLTATGWLSVTCSVFIWGMLGEFLVLTLSSTFTITRLLGSKAIDLVTRKEATS